MAGDGPTAHVPERRGYGSCGGGATPAPGDLAGRDFTAGMPNGKWPADIARDQGRGREGRASRRRSTATTAGSPRTRPVPAPTPGSPTGCPPRPWNHCRREHIPWRVPAAAATAGGPDGRRSWAAAARLGRRAPKGPSPDDAAAEGFFGRMRTESVHPGHREERTRDGALAPVDDGIRRHDHKRIKRSLGWMSPVQYRQSQGTAA